MKPSKRGDKRGGGDVEGPVIDYCTCNCRTPVLRQQKNNHMHSSSLTVEDAIFSPGVSGLKIRAPFHGVTVAEAVIKHIWVNATTQKEDILLLNSYASPPAPNRKEKKNNTRASFFNVSVTHVWC